MNEQTLPAAQSMPLTTVITQLLLAANLAIFLAYGVGFLAAPQTLATHFDITLGSLSAVADFRAMYGGMCLGVGAIYALGLRHASWRSQALLLATLTSAGLALGRVVTIVADGVPGRLVLLYLAMEVVGAASGVVILSRKASAVQPALR